MVNMLTKDDLLQIRNLIRAETRSSIREETPPIVERIIQPLKLDISVLKLAVARIVDDVTILRKDITEIREDLHIIVQVFDERLTKLERSNA